MGQYTATVSWRRGADEPFVDNRYSRGHNWSFDGGVAFRASASPHVVGKWADPAGVDPEEAFVAALSSCHMLSFLYLAGRAGHRVDSYDDTALGVMTKNAAGQLWVSTVTLRPMVVWTGTPAEELALHHAAHEECFIANSVKTDVRCEPIPAPQISGS
jgi:organic hydroperoxide reductase OsmC/OhrA